MSEKYSLAINRCPLHGFWSVSIDTESGGVRLTEGKCCGRWDVVKSWPLTPALIDNIVTEVQSAAEDEL